MDKKGYLNYDTSTVEGRMANLTNTPLARQARTQALQAMNRSGRVNSAMAEGYADVAMYQALLPMAQQDAETYAAFDALQANYDFQKDFMINSANFNLLADQMELDSQERQQMTATLGGMYATMINNIGAILRDPDLNADAMQAAINELYIGYQDTVQTYANLFGWNINWGE